LPLPVSRHQRIEERPHDWRALGERRTHHHGGIDADRILAGINRCLGGSKS
jgi:hypothetical protein